MNTATRLEYQDLDFLAKARKLIANGTPFVFEVAGEAFQQLKPLMEDGTIRDTIPLGTKPKLQALAGVIAYSNVKERQVEVSELPNHLEVAVR